MLDNLGQYIIVIEGHQMSIVVTDFFFWGGGFSSLYMLRFFWVPFIDDDMIMLTFCGTSTRDRVDMFRFY
jgi:hypothetical protein